MDVLARELEQLVGENCEDVILRDYNNETISLNGTFIRREDHKPFTFVFIEKGEVYAIEGIFTSDLLANRNVDRPANMRIAQYIGGQIFLYGTHEKRRVDPKSREFLECRRQLTNAELYSQHSQNL